MNLQTILALQIAEIRHYEARYQYLILEGLGSPSLGTEGVIWFITAMRTKLSAPMITNHCSAIKTRRSRPNLCFKKSLKMCYSSNDCIQIFSNCSGQSSPSCHGFSSIATLKSCKDTERGGLCSGSGSASSPAFGTCK